MMLNIPEDCNLHDTCFALNPSPCDGPSPCKRIHLESATLSAVNLDTKRDEDLLYLFASFQDDSVQWFASQPNPEPFRKLAWEVCSSKLGTSPDSHYDETSKILDLLDIPHQHESLRVLQILSCHQEFEPSLCNIPIHDQIRLLLQLVDDLQSFTVTGMIAHL
jgi:hypothetical protein